LGFGLPIKRFPVGCPAAAIVSLNKELYSHCSSLPSCINGDLAIAGEANANWQVPGRTTGAYTVIHEAWTAPLWDLVLPQEDLPAQTPIA